MIPKTARIVKGKGAGMLLLCSAGIFGCSASFSLDGTGFVPYNENGTGVYTA